MQIASLKAGDAFGEHCFTPLDKRRAKRTTSVSAQEPLVVLALSLDDVTARVELNDWRERLTQEIIDSGLRTDHLVVKKVEEAGGDVAAILGKPGDGKEGRVKKIKEGEDGKGSKTTKDSKGVSSNDASPAPSRTGSVGASPAGSRGASGLASPVSLRGGSPANSFKKSEKLDPFGSPSSFVVQDTPTRPSSGRKPGRGASPAAARSGSPARKSASAGSGQRSSSPRSASPRRASPVPARRPVK